MENYIVTKEKSFIIYSLIFGVLLGIGIVERMINNDPRIMNSLYKQFQEIFHEQFHGTLHGTPARLNLIFPELIFENVCVTPREGDDWQWQADRLSLGFSWLQVLMNKSVNLNVTLQGVSCASRLINGVPTIADHIKRFIVGKTAVPINLNGLLIKNGSFYFSDQKNSTDFAFKGQCRTGVYGKHYRIQSTITEGVAKLFGKALFNNAKGSVGLDLKEGENAPEELNIDLSCDCQQLPDKECMLSGHWHTTKGQCALYNKSKTLACSVENVSIDPRKEWHYQGVVPLEFLLHYGLNFCPSSLKGIMSAHGSYQEKRAQEHEGEIICTINNFSDKKMVMHYTGENSVVQGEVFIGDDEHDYMQGRWFYDLACHYGEYFGYNALPLRYNLYEIPRHGVIMQGTWQQGVMNGIYHLLGYHKKFDFPFFMQGSFIYQPEESKLRGNYNEYTYALHQTPLQTEATLRKKTGERIISCTLNPGQQIAGSCDFGVIQKILQGTADTHLSGHGNIDFIGTYSNAAVYAQCSMKDSSIRLFDTHNIIKNMSTDLALDFNEYKGILKNTRIACQKGTISSQKIVCHADPVHGLEYVHCPLILNNLFINSGKDLFTVVTGHVLLHKEKEAAAALEGNLIIERAKITKNIFNELRKQSLNGLGALPQSPEEDLKIALSVESRNPIQVATDSISALVQARLNIQGTLSHPDISGLCNILDGELHFPYRPLRITKGKLYFLPQQMQDPLIEMQAKAKVRNYYITMHCTGSLQQPHISFESTPPLTEEQIMTLLLAGSEEGSLSMIMPAMVMQRLQHMIFGGDKAPSVLGSYLKNILKPLRFIRLVPKFTDQTARGGIRGAIEVDVTDHLRAIIQKNFSITEDTKIEVEYYLSDEITIRGIKDERTDIGAEVEMRWKF